MQALPPALLRPAATAPVPATAPAPTIIEMEGVTLVEVDEHGLVTHWRDYFDMKGVEDRMRGGAR